VSTEPLRHLIERWRADPGATYRTWFLWEERLKNFRSIRRGIEQVVQAIESNTFGNVYKGSVLETVVGCIAEQRQIFKGADHAFLWKPKLRIPDIYENRDNQVSFGRFLDVCACCKTEEHVLDAIRQLDRQRIKGLGPAAANLLSIREAIELTGAAPLVLLHGLPSFPVPLEETRLRDLEALKERYRAPVGFLDRTDGGSGFALVAPALAAASGADLVEKHFTLDRSRKGRDYQPSLGPEDFYRMVELLRQAERARGDGTPALAEESRRGRRELRRSVVAGGLIPRGEVLTAAMLAFKRTDERFEAGIAPRDAHRVIGRRAVRPIQADEIIREDMLE